MSKVYKLTEVVDFIGGSQPPKSKFSYNKKENYIRLIQIRDYKTDNHIVYIPKNSTKKFCTDDDIMIGRYGPPVFQILRGLNGAYNVALMKAKPKIDFLSKEYLFRFLQNPSIQNYIIGLSQRSAGQSGVNKVALEEYEILVPPLKEQKRIVAKLDNLFGKIDQAITLHQQNIDEVEGVMGSALSEVFGELEENYEKKKLKTIVKIIGGGTPSKKEPSYWDNGDIKWATVKDMNVETIVNTELSITKVGLKNSSSNIIPKNGIIIATRVGLGKVCYLNEDTAINQDLKGILPLNEDLDIRFLYNYFKNISRYIINNGTGATVKGVKLDFIQSIEISLPPLKVQQKTVTYLNNISEKTETIKRIQKEKMQSLKELKASILDRAFRGEL